MTSSDYQLIAVCVVGGCVLLTLAYLIVMVRRYDKQLMKENLYLIQLLRKHLHKLTLDEQRAIRERFAKTIDQL